MTQHKRIRNLASAALCASVLALCLIPTLPWAQSRGGTLVKETVAPPEKQFTGSYALLVGVSQYKHWSNLPGVDADIAAMERLLTSQGFEVQKAFPKSREELELAYIRFINLRGQAKLNRLVLYFAGHGVSLPLEYGDDQKMGYILAPEAPLLTGTNMEQVRQAALDLETMFTYARRIQSLQALFVFDSCFAGDFLSRGEPKTSNLYVDYLASKPIRQFVTAGGAGETVPDRSLFRKMLERALREGAADGNLDGYVTGTELKTYLQATVMYYSKGTQHPQYGVMRDPDLDKGDFIFKVNGPPPPPTPVPVPVPPPTPAPTPSFLDRLQAQGGEWISLSGGTFTMGSNDGNDDEKPPHKVTVSSFKMLKTEVTVAQYRACVEAKGCTKPRTKAEESKCNWGYPDRDNHPINCVDWNQSKAFAVWLGGDARLPTEAEWEYAARGEKGRKYPWGDTPEASCERAVIDSPLDVGMGCGKHSTWPVCSKTPGNTPEGLCDLAGNVLEWTEDWDGAYSKDDKNDPSGPVTGENRVLRGGSWLDLASVMRGANRRRFWSRYNAYTVGFRVVVPLSRRGSR